MSNFRSCDYGYRGLGRSNESCEAPRVARPRCCYRGRSRGRLAGHRGLASSRELTGVETPFASGRGNPAGRLTSVGSTSYTYDNNGDLTARGSDSFSGDAADRLTSATVSSTTTTFAYNGDGLRDSLTTGGNTTTSTWDIAGGLPVELYDGTLSYVYGLGRISQIDGSGNTYYYLPDALGSTMAVVDSSGTVADIYNYDAFGAVRSFSALRPTPSPSPASRPTPPQASSTSAPVTTTRRRGHSSAATPCPASTASPMAAAIRSATWTRRGCATSSPLTTR